MVEARRAFAAERPRLDARRLIFPDETWATTLMASTCAWAPKGRRLLAAVPHGHWLTTTFVCGLRAGGLVAPLVMDGAIDDVAFLADIEPFLTPTLAKEDAVVLDNLSSRKVKGAYAKPLRRVAPGCSSCRPTAPT